MAAWVVAVAFLICTSTQRAAHAEPPSDAALIWQAPDSCPDAAEVRARVARRLGAPIDRVVHGVAVDVAIQRDSRGARYIARIDLRGLRSVSGPVARAAADAGTDAEIRVLTSARCDELTDAVAVVIARIAAEAAPAGGLGGELRAERPAAPRDAAPAPRPSWGGGLRLIGLSGIGALPGVSVGGELSGYVRARWLLAELAGMTWVRNVSFLRAGGPARIDVGLALAAVRVGWGPEHLPLRAWLTAELGQLRGEGIGLEDPPVGTRRWLAVGAGFAVAWPMFEHARLVGTIELAAPLQRERFALSDGSELYRPGPVTVRSGFGLEVGWR